MGSQASVNTNDKEQQLKKASKMSLIRSLLPIVGLVVIFLLFNFLTDFRMMGNMSLVLSQVYVTMISAMGVFFIMTMGGLDFSQGSILGISSIVVCMLSKYSIPLAIIGGIAAGAAIGAINLYCNNLYHVLIPWFYQVPDNQRSGSRICKADQL